MNPCLSLLLALQLFGWALPVQAADPLRFAVSQSWTQPYADLSRPGQPTGLMIDLMAQIAANAGAEPRYVILPSKRVDAALAQNSVDLHCLMSPAWATEPLTSPRWSVALLALEDVLIAAPGLAATPLDLAAQRQLPIGVVLGYGYRGLDQFFLAGQLLRDDAPSQQRMLDKLLRGRTSYAVLNSLSLDWYNRSRPLAEQLVRLQVIDQMTTYCLLAQQPSLNSQRILAAVRKLVDSGQLTTILRRYR